MARHEFRFVIDGIDITDDQRTQIAREIQSAGLAALQTVNARLTRPVSVGHGHPGLRPEWYGLWVLDGPFADEIGQRINDIGFYAK